MDKQTEHLENLSEIRSMMERSSRFISLSGLSGVFAGIFALAGATAAYLYLDLDFSAPAYQQITRKDIYTFLFTDAILVLVASVSVASVMSMRKAKQKGQKIWDATAKRLFINMMIPLVTGGLFCLIILYHGLVGLVAPATLIFYGLALVNASKYTLNDIRYLGICQILLGLMASVYIGYGLLFWAVGFGILHIVYGIVMYRKYEQ
jgi:hypothetical protein